MTQQTNDKQEVVPVLENLATLPESLGTVTHLVADTGYYSEANVEACEAHGVEPVLSSGRATHHPPVGEGFSEPLPPPADADAVTRMRYRLQTPEGKQRYAKRKSTIEPVFGILKHVLGFRQFLLRGVEAVRGEWTLLCIAWDLKRLHTLMLAKTGKRWCMPKGKGVPSPDSATWGPKMAPISADRSAHAAFDSASISECSI